MLNKMPRLEPEDLCLLDRPGPEIGWQAALARTGAILRGHARLLRRRAFFTLFGRSALRDAAEVLDRAAENIDAATQVWQRGITSKGDEVEYLGRQVRDLKQKIEKLEAAASAPLTS